MNIRSRLLLLVLVAILVPTFLIGLRFYTVRDKEIETAVGSLSASANEIAAALHEKILGTAQLHYGLARARDLETTDRTACSAFLNAVLREHPQYTGILTINPDGRLFCDSLGTGRELDLRDRKYFQQASSTVGGVALEAVFGRLTGIAVLQIAYPVRAPSGDLSFILLASLSLELFVEERALRGREILLTADDGTVLAWSPKETRARHKGTSIAKEPLFAFAAAQESGGAGEVTGIDGNREIWAVAGLPDLRLAGVRVLVGQPKSDLVASANRNLLQELAVLAIVAVFLFLGVWLLAELGIRRQVARIGAMATQLGAGDLQARIPPPHPGGELGDLMTVLNGAAESLQRQHDAIEDLNRKLRQSQKMEAVGQLTGGVAHDFNNLLTVILGNAETLVDELSRQPELRRLAEIIMTASLRGADLTRSLLAFARRQPLAPQSIDVNRLIFRMENMLRRTLGETVEWRFLPGADVRPAMVDPAQLESAILNMALNARDAMPGGGKLTVETANVILDRSYAERNEEVRAGEYVMIAVGDSGCGMTADVVARAFEPFFTTKEVGKGTGLGLSMVYGFVKQSDGHIRIYSEPGHGTIVRLYLPRADASPGETGVLPPTALSIVSGTILAVEDDDLVRAYVAGELKTLGYFVLTARNGAEALEILRGGATVDMLFSDVVMPGGLSGPQLAQEALKIRPGLKVLYTSGYTENTVIHGGKLDPGVQLLSKPYLRHELASKLRAVLQGA